MQRNNMTKKENRGASLVEYALLVALIAIAVIVAMRFLASGISTQFSSVGSTVQAPAN